jgi:hypothetical protein
MKLIGRNFGCYLEYYLPKTTNNAKENKYG